MGVDSSLRQRALHGTLSVMLGLVNLVSRPLSLASMALRWFRLRYVMLKPRPGDIYVATAPKTGTTWMQQIVHQILTGGRGEFEHIYQVSPYLEHLLLRGFAEAVLDALPSPRILKTHMTWWLLAPPPDSRIIYVTRNAADSLVSLHNHVCLEEGYRHTLDVHFLRRNFLLMRWFRHLETWWRHRADPNVLHLRYEELAADLEGGIRKVARFLGVTLEEDRMGAILEKCSFAYMKQHGDRFDVRVPIFDRGAPKPSFLRKGMVGDGRAMLTPEVQTALGERMGPLRKKLGIGETEV
ncbi:sulfotransferase domain-containing protein [Pyxidicoccus sp. 3LG]